MTMTARTQSAVLFAAATILFIIFFVFLLAVLPAHAQVARYPALEHYPVFEGFLGTSVSNNDFGGVRYAMPGWHISFALNPSRKVRVVADFAGQYRHTNIQSTTSTDKVRLEEDQLLFGPEFVWRKSRRATPFVHTLAGVAGRHYYTPSGDPLFPRNVLEVDYGFASALGGGADVTLSRRWALRALQFDYVLTHLSHQEPQYSGIPLPTLGTWQHNYRLAFGVVLRLGTRGEVQ